MPQTWRQENNYKSVTFGRMYGVAKFSGKRSIILYALVLFILLFFLKWIEYHLVIIDHAFEIYIACIALVFTSLGIWVALSLTKRSVNFTSLRASSGEEDLLPAPKNVQTIVSLSKRELEVLSLIAEGFSNQQIADKLFVSLNTVKTHSSKLFEKLEVERRTQAVDRAKKLGILG